MFRVTFESGALILKLLAEIANDWVTGPLAKLSTLTVFAVTVLSIDIYPRALEPVPAVSCKVPVLPLKVIGWSISKFLYALKVKFAVGLPACCVMGALTLMFPDNPPPPVVGTKTVTLVPAFSKFVMSLFSMVEPFPDGDHVFDEFVT